MTDHAQSIAESGDSPPMPTPDERRELMDSLLTLRNAMEGCRQQMQMLHSDNQAMQELMDTGLKIMEQMRAQRKRDLRAMRHALEKMEQMVNAGEWYNPEAAMAELRDRIEDEQQPATDATIGIGSRTETG